VANDSNSNATVTVRAAADGDYATLLGQARDLYDRGDLKKATTLLEQAVAVNANGDEALVLLANCHLDRGALDKAVASAQLATSANPQNAEAWLVVGAVHQQREKFADARSAYEKYLKLAPKGRYAGEIRTILGSMPQ
jgi:Flp pilus assembly protein TadD